MLHTSILAFQDFKQTSTNFKNLHQPNRIMLEFSNHTE